MATITKLYPLLKEIGLDDQKSQEFIEIIEESNHSKIEQETNRLVTNETFLTEISKIKEELTRKTTSIREEMSKMREDMASMKVELIKWNVGTIIAVAGIVTAIVKLIG